MQLRPRVYFEDLDAARFICFLLVFFYHSFHTSDHQILADPVYQLVKFRLFGNGNLAVNFFFVLSGFLITYLLLEEKQRYGKIDIPRFWLRRALRIWPLFYLCVFLGFLLFPLLKEIAGEKSHETATLWMYLTFTNNFDFIKNGADASVLSVLWSIAVEEQFYLAWPLIVGIIPARFYSLAFGSVLLCSLAFRAAYDDVMMHEYHTLSCMGDMTVGSLGALWSQQYNGKTYVANWSRLSVRTAYVLITVVFLFRKEIFGQLYLLRVFERPMIACLFLMVILQLCFQQNGRSQGPFTYRLSQLGTMTYGFYCLHFWGILAATHFTGLLSFNNEVWQVLVTDTALALVITLACGFCSYRYWEIPFLKLKSKFSRLDTNNHRALWKRET